MPRIKVGVKKTYSNARGQSERLDPKNKKSIKMVLVVEDISPWLTIWVGLVRRNQKGN
jgi:hypothetical protein